MVTVIDLTDDGDTPPPQPKRHTSSSSSSAGTKRIGFRTNIELDVDGEDDKESYRPRPQKREIRPPPKPLRPIPKVDVDSLKRAAASDGEDGVAEGGTKKKPKLAEVRRDLKRTASELVAEGKIAKIEITDGKKYILAIDPGTVNCAWSWLDMEQERAKMQLWDFSVWDGYSHDMKEGYGDRIIVALKKMQSMFDKTKLVVMEKQEVKGRNPAVDRIHLELAQAIRTMYPNLTFRFIRMQAVRKFWGTSGSDYEERKNNSLFTDVMSDIDHIRAAAIFKKVGGKGICEDPIEASQMAVYAYHNLARLLTPLPYPEKRRSQYELIQMDAHVNLLLTKRVVSDYRNGKTRLSVKRKHIETEPEKIDWLPPPPAKKRKVAKNDVEGDDTVAKKKKSAARSKFFRKSKFFRRA